MLNFTNRKRHIAEMKIFSRKMALALAFAAMVAAPSSARTVRDFFANEEGGIFASLPHDRRLDMLDYYEAGQQMPMTNNFGGTAVIDTLTSDYLRLRTSGSSHVELLLATSRRDTVLYVVTTCLLPAADSHVTVYDTNWNTLDTERYFKVPQITDFISIPKGDKTRREDVARDIKLPTIEYSFDPTSRQLTATHTIKGTMTVEGYTAVKPYLTDTLTYQLKGTKIKSMRN